jgi:hypothetical protein
MNEWKRGKFCSANWKGQKGKIGDQNKKGHNAKFKYILPRNANEEWLRERQSLVQTISRLHSALQRIHREMVIIQPVPIGLSQLEALAQKLREMREKEAELGRRETELKSREEAEWKREVKEEARKEAAERMQMEDWQMERVEASIQGYQLNILTLGAELKKTRERVGGNLEGECWPMPKPICLIFQLEKAEKKLEEKQAELDELRRAFGDFEFVLGMDLKLIEGKIANKLDKGGEDKIKEAIGQIDKNAKEEKARGHQRQLPEKDGEEKEEEEEIEGRERRQKVIVLNNSMEWEQQMKMVREQAKLCVESYKANWGKKGILIKFMPITGTIGAEGENTGTISAIA